MDWCDASSGTGMAGMGGSCRERPDHATGQRVGPRETPAPGHRLVASGSGQQAHDEGHFHDEDVQESARPDQEHAAQRESDERRPELGTPSANSFRKRE